MPAVLAVAAHPDDVEFLMAGALILLVERGWEAHVLNLADGRCGTATEPPPFIAGRRAEEARESCALIGATWHPPVGIDLHLHHDVATVSRVVALVRAVRPSIILTHSPSDYMEDHEVAARIAVTAAFARGMINYPSEPEREADRRDVTVYHAQPHGNRDSLRRLVRPGLYVDIGGVIGRKRAMLACHRSQKEWLDASQGMDSYLNAMTGMAREVGRMSGRFEFAEGFRRRNHLGLSVRDHDPLAEVLGGLCRVDELYEAELG